MRSKTASAGESPKGRQVKERLLEDGPVRLMARVAELIVRTNLTHDARPRALNVLVLVIEERRVL